jgi:cell division protein FtsB
LNKDATTYWNNLSAVTLPKKKNRAKRSVKQSKTKTPQWFIFIITVSITFMLCLAINFRAFSDLRSQTAEHQQLTKEIETLTTGNLVLQEEIQNLKSDPRTIEREARKIGMSRPNEKILVPTIR